MAPPAVLMVGTGEYTTGFVSGAASTSDKKIGVVGLTLFDLRRRGKVSDLSMVGVSGKKFPAIRAHLQKNIRDAYNGLDVSFQSFPPDDKTDPEAYRAAIDALPKGSAVTIFTPDSTHYPIARYAIQRGHHVLVTKPATKLLAHHLDLLALADAQGVLVYVEHHKRFDPAYADARFRARALGDFNYFYSYMSQPKSQLETFRAWAGRDSDISYYLNSHHVDICEWMVRDAGWRPTTVRASASLGVAEQVGCVKGTEDTITLLVDWTRTADNKRATGIYTASWTAPMNAGVHSQQHFHYVASGGEINVNQAKRGYDVVDEADRSGSSLKWYNPFYMRYAPDEEGNFNGQSGYGYVSFEKFIDGVTAVNDGRLTVEQLDKRGLPTLRNTVLTTAILEAGRRSLDEGNRLVEIVVGEGDRVDLK
ncbi:oxidoreductase [Cladophialophora yegresii CBS 114405]|uniref:Oxidoreductase n=1 Tax=Cladophialophora yegresii CBS 114405 TaxID=1182544 RepID=W9WHF1_9EURO|nr:oxidoreductase [Cladophialophora yegresii CBS 114405]EXJ64400.1 oxidoreductase [Cladophialophora yegresii CBS 114405]